MSPLGKRITIAVIILAVIGGGAGFALSRTTSSTTSSSEPAVVLAADSCRTSHVTFSAPGSPARIASGVYMGVTLTNREASPCTFPKVSQQLPPVNVGGKSTTAFGYGIIFAQGWADGHAVGPVSYLRGTAGSSTLTLTGNRASASPSAEFTLGVTPSTQVPNCSPQKVTSFALSTDRTTWQVVKLNTTSFFPHGIEVCTGSTSNINTSPASLIPSTPSRARPSKHQPVTHQTVAHKAVVPSAGTTGTGVTSTTTKKH